MRKICVICTRRRENRCFAGLAECIPAISRNMRGSEKSLFPSHVWKQQRLYLAAKNRFVFWTKKMTEKKRMNPLTFSYLQNWWMFGRRWSVFSKIGRSQWKFGSGRCWRSPMMYSEESGEKLFLRSISCLSVIKRRRIVRGSEKN